MYCYSVDCHNASDSEYHALKVKLDSSSYVGYRESVDRVLEFCDESADELIIRKTYEIPHQCPLRRIPRLSS